MKDSLLPQSSPFLDFSNLSRPLKNRFHDSQSKTLDQWTPTLSSTLPRGYKWIRANRARMQSWLLMVAQTRQLRWSTYWTAVEILDHLIEKHEVDTQSLQLYGAVVLFISAKFNETKALSIKTLLDQLCGSKYSPHQIRQLEARILHLLEFRVQQSSLLRDALKLPCSSHKDFLRRLTLCFMDPGIALMLDSPASSIPRLLQLILESMTASDSPFNRHLQDLEAFLKNHYKCELCHEIDLESIPL